MGKPERLQYLLDAVEGAFHKGYEGVDKPPEGHWLHGVWETGFAQKGMEQARAIWSQAKVVAWPKL